MKASVNEDCISCGMCMDICPEVFSYNEEEKSQAITGEIPVELEKKVLEAKDSCPVEAIKAE